METTRWDRRREAGQLSFWVNESGERSHSQKRKGIKIKIVQTPRENRPSVLRQLTRMLLQKTWNWAWTWTGIEVKGPLSRRPHLRADRSGTRMEKHSKNQLADHLQEGNHSSSHQLKTFSPTSLRQGDLIHPERRGGLRAPRQPLGGNHCYWRSLCRHCPRDRPHAFLQNHGVSSLSLEEQTPCKLH